MDKTFFIERIKTVEELVEKHNQEEKNVISLIASANIVSPRVCKLMTSDLVNRVAEGKSDSAIFPGTEFFYQIDEIARNDITRIFNCGFADLRAISGSQANHIVYHALAKVGDTIILPSIRQGAHTSMSGRVVRDMKDFNFIHTKNLSRSLLIDCDDLTKKIIKYRPKLLFLGGSVIIEWQDMGNIFETVREYGGKVVFDASHVAGLIATGCFQNPLEYGVNIMTMTTCKTLPGPSHAWILGDKDLENLIDKTIFPGFVSGGHLQEHVGAIVSLYEILSYGQAYGQTVINNSRLLGSVLEDGGFEFLHTQCGKLTNTHQLVALNYRYDDINTIEMRLAQIGILLNKNILPVFGFENKYGIRLGTQEITRQGAQESHLLSIGETINEYLKEKAPDIKKYRNRVSTIKHDFYSYGFT